MDVVWLFSYSVKTVRKIQGPMDWEAANRIPSNRIPVLFLFLFLARLGGLSSGYDFVGLQRWDVIVVVEIHMERGPALRHRYQIVLIVEHFRHWHLCPDDLRAAFGVHALNAPAAAIEVAHQITGILHGSLNFDIH